MDPERSTASTIGRWVGWLVVLALTAAVVVGTLTVIGQVKERPLMRAAAPPSAGPVLADPVVAATPLAPGQPLPASVIPVAGQSVGDAQRVLQEAGAVVELSDGAGSRAVQPDWRVCGAGERLLEDGSPTGQVTVMAAPEGESCT